MTLTLIASLLGTAIPAGSVQTAAGTVTADFMLQALETADVVFIGEKHDDTLAHEWEFFIWSTLAGEERSLALEMFETDVQDILDSYLGGEITEEEFLAGSRPWGNYGTDYAPLLEAARALGCRVIAANVPRSFAAMVAGGGWDAIASEDFFLSLDIDSSSVLYRNMFLETMGAMGDQMHAMPMDPENMYRAQLLKDAVMARSISGERCVFICGSFHSDFHSGIPDQLGPGVAVLTVKILAEEEEYDPESADFVIIRP